MKDDTISRKKALDTVKAMYDRCDTGDLRDYRDLMIEAFEALPSAQQWIPVAERLPEIYQSVILCLTDGTVFAGYQGEPDCIWQVTKKDGTKLWVYDPSSYTDDINSLPTAKDCWFSTNDPDGMSYTSITSLTHRKRFPEVVAWMPLPAPYEERREE